MVTITMQPIFHRNNKQVAVQFPSNNFIKNHIKSFTGMRWSQTHRRFYFLNTSENRNDFFNFVRSRGWFVDYSAFKLPKKVPSINKDVRPSKESSEFFYSHLPKEHSKSLREYCDYLRGLRLSKSTVQVYGYFVLRFLYFKREATYTKLNDGDVKRYIEQVIAKENYSISSHRQCVSALKHFAQYATQTELNITHLQRPKKDKKLPVVLSKEEIVDLLRVTRNLKHRTVLALLYSGGLRIGELLSLRIQDIDLDRMQLHIKRAKGGKDRTVILAHVMQPLLYNYKQTFAPSHFLIEGQQGLQYNASGIRSFLKKSCQRAGITKRVTPHTLRHSYATHMMDNGVALRHIQELLGHAKPETTMIYTHVSQQDLSQVQNPLDATMEYLTKMGKGEQKVLLSRKL